MLHDFRGDFEGIDKQMKKTVSRRTIVNVFNGQILL